MPSFCINRVRLQLAVLITFKIRLERYTVKERYRVLQEIKQDLDCHAAQTLFD